MAGGYGAAALSNIPLSLTAHSLGRAKIRRIRVFNLILVSLSASNYSYSSNTSAVPKRYVAHTATFSRLATIRHVYNYLCNRLKLRPEDVRLWQFDDEVGQYLRIVL